MGLNYEDQPGLDYEDQPGLDYEDQHRLDYEDQPGELYIPIFVILKYIFISIYFSFCPKK